MENYLQETELLNFNAEEIKALIASRGWAELPESDKIKSVYEFVRDEIKFGYNAVDVLPATKVLKDGYGQCNTKCTLLMALLRGVGVPCRLHGFTVDKSLQKGTMAGLVYRFAPQNVLHSWTEVYYNGDWCALEGVILDREYLTKLQKFYFNCTGGFCGFGVATDSLQNPPIEWEGGSTYVQSKAISQDFGVFDSPDDFYQEHRQEISPVKEFLYKFLARFFMNFNVKRVRKFKV